MFDEFNKWEKGLLIFGLMLISFQIGGVVMGNAQWWPEGYQKGILDCVRIQEENSSNYQPPIPEEFIVPEAPR